MPDLPESLIAYLAQRDAARADAVTAVLESLTDRERALVKDAAVMGYVRGMTHPMGEAILGDWAIVSEVIEACLAFPDLYPAINAHFEDHQQTVEYFVQCQQPDGTWEQSSSSTTDPDFIYRQMVASRRKRPECEHRIVRSTTTVVVEAAIKETDHA